MESNEVVDRKDISSQRSEICYALFPGYVKSRKDGDMHYVGAMQLSRLYGVDIKQCIVVDYYKHDTYRGIDMSKYIKLHIMQNGNYSLLSA